MKNTWSEQILLWYVDKGWARKHICVTLVWLSWGESLQKKIDDFEANPYKKQLWTCICPDSMFRGESASNSLGKTERICGRTVWLPLLRCLHREQPEHAPVRWPPQLRLLPTPAGASFWWECAQHCDNFGVRLNGRWVAQPPLRQGGAGGSREEFSGLFSEKWTLNFWVFIKECVLLCFIIPILGNRYGPGVNSLRK